MTMASVTGQGGTLDFFVDKESVIFLVGEFGRVKKRFVVLHFLFDFLADFFDRFLVDVGQPRQTVAAGFVVVEQDQLDDVFEVFSEGVGR